MNPFTIPRLRTLCQSVIVRNHTEIIVNSNELESHGGVKKIEKILWDRKIWYCFCFELWWHCDKIFFTKILFLCGRQEIYWHCVICSTYCIIHMQYHSLNRGVLIQSCSAGAKKFTNYVFCHPQFSGVIQNIENCCAIFTTLCLCRLLSK